MENFSKKKMIIAVAGGGTAGHIMPALAVMEKIKDSRVIFIGPKSEKQKYLIEKLRIPYFGIQAGKLRRYFDWRNFWDPVKVVAGIFQSFCLLKKNHVVVLFCKGGFASVPPALAAKILGIPVVLHESDSVPGLANRIIGKFACKVCLGFEQARQYFNNAKIVITGNPVRENFSASRIAWRSKSLARKLKIDKKRPVVLVLGGSQGSLALNNVFKSNLENLLKKYVLIQISGELDYQNLRKSRERLAKDLSARYFLFKFVEDDLPALMNLADIIVSRAGAGALSEIAALGKPSILVPLPGSAQDHQRKNAQIFVSADAAVMVEQEKLKVKICSILDKILADKTGLKAMGKNAKKFFEPDSAKKIAETILVAGWKASFNR